MTVCEGCGAEVDQGARFCGECGGVVRQKTREFGAEKAPSRGKAQTRPMRSRDTVREPRGKPQPSSAVALRNTQRGGTAPALPIATPTGRPDPVKTTMRGVAGVSEPPAPTASKPPTAITSEMPTVSAVGSAEERTEFKRLLEEVETGFDAIHAPLGAPPPEDDGNQPTSEIAFDDEQAAQLFRDLVVAHAGTVRDLMVEVRLGEPALGWLDFAEPALTAIARSAKGMGNAELVTRLGALEAAFASARRSKDGLVRGVVRERMIDAYSELIVFFPEAFGLEERSQVTEAAIVASLLGQVEGLTPLGISKVMDAGLGSLGLLYVSRADDLCKQAHLAPDVAERIVTRVVGYRKQASELSPVEGRAAERALLRSAVKRLVGFISGYEKAPPASEARRAARRARHHAMLEISLWLARLGERDRLLQLGKLPFASRVLRLEELADELDLRARKAES